MSLDEKNLQCNINNDCGNTALINSLPAAHIKSPLLYSPSRLLHLTPPLLRSQEWPLYHSSNGRQVCTMTFGKVVLSILFLHAWCALIA